MWLQMIGAVVVMAQSGLAAASPRTTGRIYYTYMAGASDYSEVCESKRIGGSWSSWSADAPGFSGRCWTRHRLGFRSGYAASKCAALGGAFSSTTAEKTCWWKEPLGPQGADYSRSAMASLNLAVYGNSPACMTAGDSAVCKALGGTRFTHNLANGCYDCFYSSKSLFVTPGCADAQASCESPVVRGRWGGGNKCWTRGRRADVARIQALEERNCTSAAIRGSYRAATKSCDWAECWHSRD